MVEGFVNRESELGFLERKKNSNSSEFVVLYGRRRVGKTELVKQFLGEDGVYHLVSRETTRDQISEFKQSVSKVYPEIQDLKEDWSTILRNITGEVDVLVIDEFQYLIETDKEILKILQKAWDEHLKDSNIMLVLTGSSVGMMENEVLNYKSPLYGRRTGQWLLEPMKFKELDEFLPSYSMEQRVDTYAILGGTPFYLNQFSDDKSVIQNVEDEILRKGEVLNEEAENLLRQELREPKNYFSILKAIALGENRFNQIQNSTGIDKNSLSVYTKRLRNLQLVEKELPVTASDKSKRGRYRIKDNYYSFWFKYILPNKSAVQQNPGQVAEKIEESLPRYTGKKFEEICQEAILESGRYTEVGRWWYKEDEIDIVALNESSGEILFAECKWTSQKVGVGLLRDLEDKSEKVRWENKDTREEEYVLFSKNGFTQDLLEEASKREDLELYDLDGLSKRFL